MAPCESSSFSVVFVVFFVKHSWKLNAVFKWDLNVYWNSKYLFSKAVVGMMGFSIPERHPGMPMNSALCGDHCGVLVCPRP